MRNGVNSFPLILFLLAFIVALFIHFSTSFLLSALSNGTLLNIRIDFLFSIFSLSFKKEEISWISYISSFCGLEVEVNQKYDEIVCLHYVSKVYVSTN